MTTNVQSTNRYFLTKGVLWKDGFFGKKNLSLNSVPHSCLVSLYRKKSHNYCFPIKTILNDNKRPLNKTLFFNQRSIFNELFPEKQSGKLFL